MAKTIEVPAGFSAVVVFINDAEEGEKRSSVKVVSEDEDLAPHGLVAEAIMALAANQADDIDELLEEEEDEDPEEEEEPS